MGALLTYRTGNAKKSPGVRITADSALGLYPGVIVADERGGLFRAHSVRGHLMTAHPLVGGVVAASATTAVRFLLTPDQVGAYPTARNEPIYDTGRNYDDEQRIWHLASLRQAGPLASARA